VHPWPSDIPMALHGTRVQSSAKIPVAKIEIADCCHWSVSHCILFSTIWNHLSR